MDTVKTWVLPILSILAPLVTGLISAGPIGAIIGAVAGGAILVGGIVLFNKFKAWQFANVQKQEQQQASADAANTIKNNQQQAQGDAASIAKAQLLKEKAKAELSAKKPRKTSR